MNLVGYLRVSTDEQVRNGQGLDIQRSQIERWAKANAHTVLAWCEDRGVSGKVRDRDGLLGAYDLLNDPRYDGVVAQADTRYGRSLEVQEAFYGHVWSLGKHVFTTQVGEILEDDPDDPMRTAIRRICGVMAELDAGLIAKRLRDGRKAKKAAGGFTGGPVAFGWRVVGGEWVPVAHEQRTLGVIRDLRLSGLSLYAIVKELNGRKLLTQHGSAWNITTLSRQLPPGVHPHDRPKHVRWLQNLEPTKESA